MESEKIRLNKYLASCGIASRREADRLIEAGEITVNGMIADTGMKVSDADIVEYNGSRVKNISGTDEKHVLAFYKPVGVTVTEKDEHAKYIVSDYIDYPVRLTYAGRLDKDSEGLLIMTNDGNLINAMMKGAHRHEKEYIVTVNKELTPEQLDRFRDGIFIKELGQKTRKCVTEQTGKNSYRIILTQGLNRQIRRMFGYFDIKVKTLKRIRVMNIKLGDLKPGKWRRITDKELRDLYKDAGLGIND